MDKAFVIVRSENQYDQFGEYFVAVFKSKPSIEQIDKILPSQKKALATHIRDGGGRQERGAGKYMV